LFHVSKVCQVFGRMKSLKVEVVLLLLRLPPAFDPYSWVENAIVRVKRVSQEQQSDCGNGRTQSALV